MATPRKKFLPISERKVREIIVEFLGNNFVFYMPLSAKRKQTIMLTMVAKQFYCVKLFKGGDGRPAEFVFYEADENGHIRNTCSFYAGDLSESQRKVIAGFPIGSEVTDTRQKFKVMYACQKAYALNKKRRKESDEKFRLA